MPRRGAVRTLLVLLLACTAHAYASPLLLIVGDVTATSARVLYDNLLPSAGLHATARVFVRVLGDAHAPSAVYTVHQELTIDLSVQEGGRPQVLTVQKLTPNRQHVIAFQIEDHPQSEETVRFRTATGSDAVGDAKRVLVASCDRFVDDRDDEMWFTISQDIDANADSYFGMAHIGDQVYVDAGSAGIPIQPVTSDVWANKQLKRNHYNTIVGEFRTIYRETLGRDAAQRVLRQGAHWMIPDDHEVINNFNSFFVDRAFGSVDGSLDEATKYGTQLHYRAGLQAMYEYQYQLRADISWDAADFLSDPLEKILESFPLYFAVDVDNLKLFFMDVRFDRSVTIQDPAERYRLVSEEQTYKLKRDLTDWSSDSTSNNAIVVLASMPLFFHSPISAEIAYAMEKELYPGHPEHRQGLEELFSIFHWFLQRPNPALKLLVGGDVHTLAHTRVCGSSESQWRCLDQLITSGLTKGSTAIRDAKLIPFYLLITRLQPLYDWLASYVGMQSAPWLLSTGRVYFGRNYGVLEMSPAGVFEWKNSVTLPHKDVGHQLTQWAFDVFTNPALIIAAVSLWSVVKTFQRMRLSATGDKQKDE